MVYDPKRNPPKLDIETLKAWCHWKRLEMADARLNEPEDLDLVRSIENVVGQVNNYKVRYERELERNAGLLQGDGGDLKKKIERLEKEVDFLATENGELEEHRNVYNQNRKDLLLSVDTLTKKMQILNDAVELVVKYDPGDYSDTECAGFMYVNYCYSQKALSLVKDLEKKT